MSEAPASTRLYYVVDFSDETIPCAPTLEAWAAWLHGGTPGEAAENTGWRPTLHGATLAIDTLDLLDDLVVTAASDGVGPLGAVTYSGAVAPGADFFARRFAPGCGWGPDAIYPTFCDLIGEIEAGDVPVHVAQGRRGPLLTARFLCDAPGPRLEILP